MFWFKLLFGRFNFNEGYVAAMMKRNDITWQTSEKHLYYSYKNSNWILPSILIGAFCCICSWEAILLYLLEWLPFVYINCHWNNLKLDADKRVVSDRFDYMALRVKNGEI